MTTVHAATYELLRAQGMTTMFGNPGSNELTFLDQLPDDFRYVLALHEGAGLAMAECYSQVTGRPVLVSLHAAAGVGQAMGSLVNAQISGTPLVVMSGQQARPLITLQGQLTNVDATTLPRPLVKGSFEAPSAASVPDVLARAVHLAVAAPSGPVFVSVPLDDWRHDADDGTVERLSARSVSSRPRAAADSLAAVAARLDAARNPLLVLGAEVDASGGWDAAVALAERCAAPVMFSIELGRIPFPTDHPCYQGCLAVDIARVRHQLAGHDLVLVVGAQVFRYHALSPGPFLPDGTALIAITADPDLAARAPVGDAVVGDPAHALSQLVRLVRQSDRVLPTRRQQPAAQSAPDGSLTREQVLDAIAAERPEDAIFVSEAPSLGTWWDRVPLRRSGSYFTSAAGGLGFGLPGAVGAALAAPDRHVVALSGDGSAHYSITALWTAAQHGLPVVFVIIRNGVYGALEEFGQYLHTSGLPGTRLPGIDFVALAAGYGVPGTRVDTPEGLKSALRASFDSAAPSLIEVQVHPSNSGMFIEN
jgi:benzoylformate decarboxylase